MTDTPLPKPSESDLGGTPEALRSVAVFCGSSPGNDPVHSYLANAVGEHLAARGLRLVYGGGGLGLMGVVASAARDAGGQVLGVIPEVLREVEASLDGIEHIFVPDMHERKIRMYAESDAFIILPGGIGTMEEAVEVLSWQRLNLHNKPILFLSDTGYWDHLLAEFDRIMDQGFASKDMANDILTATTVEDAFAILQDRIDNPVERKPLGLRDVSVESLG